MILKLGLKIIDTLNEVTDENITIQSLIMLPASLIIACSFNNLIHRTVNQTNKYEKIINLTTAGLLSIS